MGDHRRRLLLVGAAIAAAVSMASVLLGDRASGKAPALALRNVGGFDLPIDIRSAPGAPGFLYVAEQDGQIGVVDHGAVRPTPFLDIRNRVVYRGDERGLLSFAFDPHYPTNHLLYVGYTNNNGDIEIDEFHAASNRAANPGSRRTVLVIPHPGASNHNGGTLQFGPDGFLYISTGDGGGQDDGFDNARRLSVLLGKLLRIKPHKNGPSAYTVPSTNPYVGRAGRDEIYSYGLRNPFRFSFDSANGNLAIADVGQNAWEEFDYVTRARADGSYFGWPTYEGIVVHDISRPDPHRNHRPPIFPIKVFSHGNGYCALIGGYVVHNPNLSLLNRRYLYSDNCRGDIRSLVPSTSGFSGDKSTGLHVDSPTAFGVGSAGQLYVTSGNYAGDGHVYQIVQRP